MLTWAAGVSTRIRPWLSISSKCFKNPVSWTCRWSTLKSSSDLATWISPSILPSMRDICLVSPLFLASVRSCWKPWTSSCSQLFRPVSLSNFIVFYPCCFKGCLSHLISSWASTRSAIRARLVARLCWSVRGKFIAILNVYLEAERTGAYAARYIVCLTGIVTVSFFR